MGGKTVKRVDRSLLGSLKRTNRFFTFLMLHQRKVEGRSSASKALNDLDYKNAVLINAKLGDWIKTGYPIEQ